MVQQTHTRSEFRGADAVSEQVVWLSGSGGTVALTTDAGGTWRVDTVPGAANMFFIGVHGVDAATAYIAGTNFDGGEARIYKTTDGGVTWSKQWGLVDPAVFLDGIAFWDEQRGVAYGDPLDGSFLLLRTMNGGDTWERVPAGSLPPPMAREASFAASGTDITVGAEGLAWIGTGGGANARVLRTTDYGATWRASAAPLPGDSTSGLFGVAFRDANRGVAVGGNYALPRDEAANVVQTTDGGRSWTLLGTTQPPGVRYGASYARGCTARSACVLVATGPSGAGLSRDDGETWTALTNDGYNTVTFGPAGTFWLAGTLGRVVRIRP
jgi:photosystem II stability/assembly factor-like uncharacterized protein